MQIVIGVSVLAPVSLDPDKPKFWFLSVSHCTAYVSVCLSASVNSATTRYFHFPQVRWSLKHLVNWTACLAPFQRLGLIPVLPASTKVQGDHFLILTADHFIAGWKQWLMVAKHTCGTRASAVVLCPPCSLGLPATSQQYFSLRTNQPSATSQNQPAVLFSQNKPAPAISHQPTEQAVKLYEHDWFCHISMKRFTYLYSYAKHRSH
jgi:hypothetical protein